MTELLLVSGLVVKRDSPGGRKYVGINRGLNVYPHLFRLLTALDNLWPATRVEQPDYRWRMPYDSELTSTRLDHMFQPRPFSNTAFHRCGRNDRHDDPLKRSGSAR